jgi:hypothetical protein
VRLVMAQKGVFAEQLAASAHHQPRRKAQHLSPGTKSTGRPVFRAGPAPRVVEGGSSGERQVVHSSSRRSCSWARAADPVR